MIPLLPPELLASYACAEPWETGQSGHSRPDSDWTATIRTTENILDRGNWLFYAISLVDMNWHTEVHEGKSADDPAVESEIVGYYRAWLGPTDDILAKVEELETRGYSVQGADKFRENCREVRGVLTDDSAFFDSEAMAELRDRAVEALREGRTADFHVLGE